MQCLSLGSDMRRREFITFLGGAAAVWPLAARAQQPERTRRVGVLGAFTESDLEAQALLAAFKKRLIELGWSDGRNVAVNYKFAGANAEHVGAMAAELIASAPDVIFAVSNLAVAPLNKATSVIPIVFAQVSDPVGSGFVSSLARPGGNITGFQGYEPAIGGKWLEVLKEIAPGVRRVAVLHNPSINANVEFLHAAEAAAPSLAVTVIVAGVRNAADIERELTAFAQEPNGGIIVTPNPATNTAEGRDLIMAMADRLRLPVIYPYRLPAAGSGLISYAYDTNAQWQGGATYVDRILRGAKPAELPVQAPTKYEMVINLKTAKALGLTLPPSLLARADEVIE
jgi:putative ABC transport system substrate-binding protein